MCPACVLPQVADEKEAAGYAGWDETEMAWWNELQLTLEKSEANLMLFQSLTSAPKSKFCLPFCDVASAVVVPSPGSRPHSALRRGRGLILKKEISKSRARSLSWVEVDLYVDFQDGFAMLMVGGRSSGRRSQ